MRFGFVLCLMVWGWGSVCFGQKPPVDYGDQVWIAYTGTTLIVRGNGLNIYKKAIIKQNTKIYDEEPLSNHEGGKEIHITVPNSLKSGRYKISLYKKDDVFAGNKEVIIINEDEFIKGNKNGCEGKIENYSVEGSLLTGLSYSWSATGGTFQALINNPQIKITWSTRNPQIQKKIDLIIEQKYIVTKIINDCDKNGNPITSKPQKTAPKRVSRPAAPEISIINSNEKNITICPESSVFLLADHDKKEKGTIKWYGGKNIKNIKEGDNYSASKAGTYRATITINGRESEKSNPIVVSTVYVPKEIKITNPSNKILRCDADKIQLTGSYHQNVEYTWRKNNQPLKVPLNYQIYVHEPGTYTLQGKVKVVGLTDGCLIPISNPITITKDTLKPLQFETIEEEKEFCKGEEITLKVQKGTEGVPYKWKYNDDKIHGETQKNHQTDKTGKFTVIQQVRTCISEATIQTKHFPTTEIDLKTIPEHGVDCDEEGKKVNIIIDNHDNFNNDAWVWKSKKETTIHSKKTTIEVQHGQYKVVGKDLNGCGVKKDITIKLNELIDNPPTITSNTGKYLLECSNDYELSLNASLSGPSKQSSTYTYKWEKSKNETDWDSIPNTKSSLQLKGKKEVGFYRVQMINDKTKCKSDFINVPKIEELKLNPQLKPTIDEYTKQICNEEKAIFTINNWDSNYFYFLYDESEKKTKKLDKKQFTISTGTYRVYCSDGEEINDGCSRVLKSMLITVNGIEITTPTITASKTTICNGESAVLIVEDPQEGVAYVWEKAGSGEREKGENNGTTYLAKDQGAYFAVAQMGGCEVKSQSSFKVKAINLSKPTITGKDFCVGSSTRLNVSNNYDKYEWSKGGTSLTENSSSIEVETAGSYNVKVTKGECTVSASKSITINSYDVPTPPQLVAPKGNKVCGKGLPLPLKISKNIEGYEYKWYVNNRPLSIPKKGSEYQISSPGKYTVRAIDNICYSKPSELIDIKSYNCTELNNINYDNLPPTEISYVATCSQKKCKGERGSVREENEKTNSNTTPIHCSRSSPYFLNTDCLEQKIKDIKTNYNNVSLNVNVIEHNLRNHTIELEFPISNEIRECHFNDNALKRNQINLIKHIIKDINIIGKHEITSITITTKTPDSKFQIEDENNLTRLNCKNRIKQLVDDTYEFYIDRHHKSWMIKPQPNSNFMIFEGHFLSMHQIRKTLTSVASQGEYTKLSPQSERIQIYTNQSQALLNIKIGIKQIK